MSRRRRWTRQTRELMMEDLSDAGTDGAMGARSYITQIWRGPCGSPTHRGAVAAARPHQGDCRESRMTRSEAARIDAPAASCPGAAQHELWSLIRDEAIDAERRRSRMLPIGDGDTATWTQQNDSGAQKAVKFRGGGFHAKRRLVRATSGWTRWNAGDTSYGTRRQRQEVSIRCSVTAHHRRW